MNLASKIKARGTPSRLFTSERVVFSLLAIFILLIAFGPVFRLAYSAFFVHGEINFPHIGQVLSGKAVTLATINTLYIALLSTCLALIIGTLAGVLTVFTKMPYKQAWVFAFVLPLMIPPQVTALAWIEALSPSNALLSMFMSNTGRHPLYSSSGIIFLLGLYNAPLVFLTLRATLVKIPAELIEAAYASGATGFTVLMRIILPLSKTGLLAGAALAFVSSIGNFGIQAMLGIPARFPTLMTLIYQKLNSIGTTALSDLAVIALFLSVLTSIFLILNSWLAKRQDVRVSGMEKRLVFNLGRWRYPLFGAAWGFLLVTLILPLFALLQSSLVDGVGQSLNLQTLTFNNYVQALFAQEAIRNAFLTSFFLTIAASVIIMILSLFLGYFLTWKAGPLVRALQISVELTYALPGIVMAIALILFFIKPLPFFNISIYGSFWLILIAYISNFLALCLRPTLGGFAQIDRSLEEAASISGALFLTRMRYIIAPLIMPSLCAGGILVFMSALNEIQVSILLVSSSTRTIGPMIIFLQESGSTTLASAVGCLIIFVILSLMLLGNAFAGKMPKGALPWHNG